jgi:hypothetical protein
MNKEFVTYKQALALKELGFDEECLAGYIRLFSSGTFEIAFYKDRTIDFNTTSNIYVSAPLKQQVFRWFREKCNLQHEIFYQDDLLKNGFKITNILSNTELTEFEFKNNYFELGGYTYEEAEDACIDKLIEIAKLQ